MKGSLLIGKTEIKGLCFLSLSPHKFYYLFQDWIIIRIYEQVPQECGRNKHSPTVVSAPLCIQHPLVLGKMMWLVLSTELWSNEVCHFYALTTKGTNKQKKKHAQFCIPFLCCCFSKDFMFPEVHLQDGIMLLAWISE